MSDRERLEKAIAAVEAQRADLGDAAVDAVLAGLQRELASIGPAEVQARLGAGEGDLAGERRIVTVLICDVVGSTALAEKLDPETWAEIMDRAFEYMTEPVDRFGGMVAQMLGDGILAFFGAPAAHEDDPQRALQAGLTILENIRSYREELQRDYRMDFKIRIGVNTGLVVTGNIGSEFHEGYTALGEAVNLTERLEETARPGTVHVSAHTYKLAASGFVFEEAGAIKVEGRNDLINTYVVLATRTEDGESRGLSTYGVSSPLTGRESEFATARAAVERLMHGQGGILYILGEAGIGKSRLVAELRKDSHARPLTWLDGRTLSYGQNISYRPFQEILQDYCQIREDDSEADAWHKLEKVVLTLFPDDSHEVLPYLASLMTLEARENYVERVRYLDGEAMRDQIIVASRRFFERLSQEQPLVLVFEDLHWADASSVRLLERLFPLIEPARLLICGVSRPDTNLPAGQLRQMAARDYTGYYTEITISPLSEDESAQLVRNLLADDDLSARTRDAIIYKADGNPFFIEEIIRDLIEEGALVQDTAAGRWRATSTVETITIPDTIQGVVTARIDRFSEGVKRVLRAAAVIGRSFRLRVLKAVLEGEQSLDDHLSTLQTTELIRIKQRLPELEYIFTHALAQEATYQSILVQTRRDIHAKVGQAIETLFAERLEEFYGLLAYHYAQAEAWEQAQEYLLKAGDQAGQIAADAEALAHYRRALKAYENAFDHDWDPLQRSSLERKMGEAYYGLGLLAESGEYFQRAIALLDRPLPNSRLKLVATLVRQIWQQLLHRLWTSRYVDRAPERKRPALQEVVRAYERLGVIFYIRGLAFPSIYAFLRSLNLAEPAGRSPELARAYANNVIAAGLVPPLRYMADKYSQLALEAARSSEDLSALAWVWQLIGIYSTGIGRWSAAIEAEEKAAEINKRIGRLRWWEESQGSLAQALHIWGHFLRSRDLYLEVFASGQTRGDRQTQVWALAGRVETGLRLGGDGYLEELIGYLEQAQALLDDYRYPNRPDKIQVLSLLAQVRLRREEWELAKSAAAAAGKLVAAEWPPSTFYTFEAYAGLPVVYMGLWKAGERGQIEPPEYETFQELAWKACVSLHGFARVFPMARPRAWLWQGTYEWRAGKPVTARKGWRKSLDYAERLDMPYDQGLTHFEIGRHLPKDDPDQLDHLNQAAQLFSKLGAVCDLEEVNKIRRE